MVSTAAAAPAVSSARPYFPRPGRDRVQEPSRQVRRDQAAGAHREARERVRRLVVPGPGPRGHRVGPLPHDLRGDGGGVRRDGEDREVDLHPISVPGGATRPRDPVVRQVETRYAAEAPRVVDVAVVGRQHAPQRLVRDPRERLGAVVPGVAEGDPDRLPADRVVPVAPPCLDQPAADLERLSRAVEADRRGRHRPEPQVPGHQVQLEVALHGRVDQDGRHVLVRLALHAGNAHPCGAGRVKSPLGWVPRTHAEHRWESWSSSGWSSASSRPASAATTATTVTSAARRSATPR